MPNVIEAATLFEEEGHELVGAAFVGSDGVVRVWLADQFVLTREQYEWLSRRFLNASTTALKMDESTGSG